MKNFVTRFSELREQKGATYPAISKAIGVSLRALKYYGAGEREAPMSVLIALADFFDISLDYLVGRSDIAERR